MTQTSIFYKTAVLQTFLFGNEECVVFSCSRVREGIFWIRDFTKIRFGNRENDKSIDGIRDLTVSQEAGLAKNWARDAGFMFACLSGMPAETVTTHQF